MERRIGLDQLMGGASNNDGFLFCFSVKELRNAIRMTKRRLIKDRLKQGEERGGGGAGNRIAAE